VGNAFDEFRPAVVDPTTNGSGLQDLHSTHASSKDDYMILEHVTLRPVFRLSLMSAGVLLGAPMPYQMLDS
jgi:hypothetical protein